MNESRRITRTTFSFFFFIIIVFSNHIFAAIADGEGKESVENEEKPSLRTFIWRIFGKTFPLSSWELIQTAIHKIQMKFYPLNLDFRSNIAEKGQEENGGKRGAGEKVKAAAKKSFGTSKETIEESAKLAGGVVGEAVQKTAEKVKKASDMKTEGSHDEL